MKKLPLIICHHKIENLTYGRDQEALKEPYTPKGCSFIISWIKVQVMDTFKRYFQILYWLMSKELSQAGIIKICPQTLEDFYKKYIFFFIKIVMILFSLSFQFMPSVLARAGYKLSDVSPCLKRQQQQPSKSITK